MRKTTQSSGHPEIPSYLARTKFPGISRGEIKVKGYIDTRGKGRRINCGGSCKKYLKMGPNQKKAIANARVQYRGGEREKPERGVTQKTKALVLTE